MIRSYGQIYDEWCGSDNAAGTLTHEEWAREGISAEMCRQACTVVDEPHSPEARLLDALAELAEERELTPAEQTVYAETADRLWGRWDAQWADDCQGLLKPS